MKRSYSSHSYIAGESWVGLVHDERLVGDISHQEDIGVPPSTKQVAHLGPSDDTSRPMSAQYMVTVGLASLPVNPVTSAGDSRGGSSRQQVIPEVDLCPH